MVPIETCCSPVLSSTFGAPALSCNRLVRAGATTAGLEEAVALCQHHDSITGTAKQHVANDYHARLHRGMKEGQAVVMNALARLVGGEAIRPSGSSDRGQSVAEMRRRALTAETTLELKDGGIGPNPVDVPVQLGACDWLNITACGPSVRLSRQGHGLLVAVYNPLGWSRIAPVRVPVDTATTCLWTVTGELRLAALPHLFLPAILP